MTKASYPIKLWITLTPRLAFLFLLASRASFMFFFFCFATTVALVLQRPSRVGQHKKKTPWLIRFNPSYSNIWIPLWCHVWQIPDIIFRSASLQLAVGENYCRDLLCICLLCDAFTGSREAENSLDSLPWHRSKSVWILVGKGGSNVRCTPSHEVGWKGGGGGGHRHRIVRGTSIFLWKYQTPNWPWHETRHAAEKQHVCPLI